MASELVSVVSALVSGGFSGAIFQFLTRVYQDHRTDHCRTEDDSGMLNLLREDIKGSGTAKELQEALTELRTWFRDPSNRRYATIQQNRDFLAKYCSKAFLDSLFSKRSETVIDEIQPKLENLTVERLRRSRQLWPMRIASRMRTSMNQRSTD